MTISTQRRMPAAMTKIPPEKRTSSSSFSRRGRRALNRIYSTKPALAIITCSLLLRGRQTHRHRNSQQIHIRRNVQRYRHVDVDLRYRRLAEIARIRVDLPVLVHGMAPKQNRADDGDIRGADDGISDLYTDPHVDESSSAPSLVSTLKSRSSAPAPPALRPGAGGLVLLGGSRRTSTANKTPPYKPSAATTVSYTATTPAPASWNPRRAVGIPRYRGAARARGAARPSWHCWPDPSTMRRRSMRRRFRAHKPPEM